MAHYTSQAQVTRLIRDLTSGGEFTEASSPTLTDVNAFMQDVANEIDSALKAAGYTTPVTLADSPEAYNYLGVANASGAAALILGSMPGESWAVLQQGVVANTRRQYLEKRLQDAITRIEGQLLPAEFSDQIQERFIIGSEKDKDGNTKLPFFTRGGFDNPGSRSLTEA